MMTTLQLVASILGSLGAIAVNPAFGVASAGAKLVPLIGMLAGLVAEGDTARAELVKLDDQLRDIVASGTAPSEASWAEWNARHETAKARLQAP